MNKKNAIIIAAVACVLSVAAMITAIAVVSNIEAPTFTPPPFDENAVDGIPEDPAESWGPLPSDSRLTFAAHLCGRLVPSDGAADVYFTNDETNVVWLKLRILDSSGNIIGETGIIKPGQYVKSIKFTDVPKSGDGIVMKIMAYQPETYHSGGSVSLRTKVG